MLGTTENRFSAVNISCDPSRRVRVARREISRTHPQRNGHMLVSRDVLGWRCPRASRVQQFVALCDGGIAQNCSVRSGSRIDHHRRNTLFLAANCNVSVPKVLLSTREDATKLQNALLCAGMFWEIQKNILCHRRYSINRVQSCGKRKTF